MAVRFYKGDLIEDAKVDIVCHQTNCQGVMGAGIAKQIRDTWPRVFGQYKLYCTRARAEGKPLLGTCQLVYTDEEKSRIVANLFGQEFYGRGKKQTDYDALRKALHALATNPFVIQNKFSIGFPYLIGCALGGGNWEIVLPIIEEEFKDYPGKVEIWEL